jgi:hypothetical protein
MYTIYSLFTPNGGYIRSGSFKTGSPCSKKAAVKNVSPLIEVREVAYASDIFDVYTTLAKIKETAIAQASAVPVIVKLGKSANKTVIRRVKAKLI